MPSGSCARHPSNPLAGDSKVHDEPYLRHPPPDMVEPGWLEQTAGVVGPDPRAGQLPPTSPLTLSHSLSLVLARSLARSLERERERERHVYAFFFPHCTPHCEQQNDEFLGAVVIFLVPAVISRCICN